MMRTVFSLQNKKIWVAGHSGLVGSAMVRALQARGLDTLTASREELDCRGQAAVLRWMGESKPDIVIMAAAKVGGIGANMRAPAEFIYDNLMIEANIMHSAHLCGVEKLLFLGSSCIYPKDAANPIVPEALMSGRLEATNAPYALAKIAGVEMCRAYRQQYGCDFISAMPCNLYGINDKYDTDRSHVIPALLMRAHQMKISGEALFPVWGSGKPLREFLYVDDLAAALIMLLENYSGAEPVNVGSGEEISIRDLAQMVLDCVGLKAEIFFDSSKPDGIMRKVLDSSVIRQMGWRPEVTLTAGIERAYADYCARYSA